MTRADAGIAIRTAGLSREFGSVRAVDDLTIDVSAGTIYGFLGPNGAGKTTTIRLLLGLLEPSAGEASVLGQDVRKGSQAIREQAGVLLESDGLYTRLTAMQNLDYFGRIARLPTSDREGRIRDLLTAMDLWDRRDGRVADFSKGMRQKLALVRAFLSRPKLLFLDEPTSGLDTPSAVALRRQLVTLARDEGVTVFLTTHNLLEAEKVCDRVAVIRRGSLLAEGSPREIHGGRARRVAIGGTGFTADLAARVARLPAVETATLEPARDTGRDQTRILVDLEPGTDASSSVRLLVEAGAEVASVETARESLEDIFLKLVEEEEAEAELEATEPSP
ncbi:MAG: ABC transporter ATP-binding protein [Gemmatimonadetes bacterium]|nr:ABC transporter ATP-binding protein [Gemmatimonadota bacterium]